MIEVDYTSVGTAQRDAGGIFVAEAESDDLRDEEALWRFISLADTHFAEKFVLGYNENWFVDAVDRDLATLKFLKRNFGGELIIFPGDTNSGNWDTLEFRAKFNPNLTPDQVILQAGKL